MMDYVEEFYKTIESKRDAEKIFIEEAAYN
jgi:hypothetical protein